MNDIVESAQDWNRLYPPGTRVAVKMRDGSRITAYTASQAQQWGRYAVLTLRGHPGLWTASALQPLPGASME